MIDMHLHTVWSDGNCTVEELVEKLSKNQFQYVVLTDHDCILGVSEFIKYCQKNQINVIKGVELEAYYNIEKAKYLHILCYKYKDDVKLNNFLEQERRARIDAIIEAIEKLKKLNINVDFSEVEQMSCGRHLLINHLCILLEKKGIVLDRKDAYEWFCNINSELYVNYPRYTVKEIIELIHRVGGIAILAHPKRIDLNKQELDNYVGILKSFGLDGIETYYGFNSNDDTKFSEYLAHKYNLIETIGSDWHCEEENIPLGVQNVPEEKQKKIIKVMYK